MRSLWKIGVLCALLVALDAESHVPDPQNLDAVQTDVIATHEWGIVKTTTTAVIQASPERVWNEITKYERLNVGIPRVLTQKDLSDGTRSVLVYFALRFPWPMRNKDLTLEFHEDKAHYRVDWHKVEGSLRDHQGDLTLQLWQDKYTLMTLSVEQDSGFFVPDFLVRRAIQKKIPSEIWRIRRELKPL